jgi:hypothetical protein
MPTADIPGLLHQLQGIAERLRGIPLEKHEIDSACWLFRDWLERPKELDPPSEQRDECRCWICRYVWRW